MSLQPLAPSTAEGFLAEADFIWHQRFDLAPGVSTPGVSDLSTLTHAAGLPSDLSGQTVLDIGTTNGAMAFEAERRGAQRVVAVDIYGPERFGFTALAKLLDSGAEFVQGSIYDLPFRLAGETFDHVVFWGVLYHLRHPLLALDNVRRLTKGLAYVETEVTDCHLPLPAREEPYVRFYRHDGLAGDGSNWFAPTIAALLEWCGSCGLDPELTAQWEESEGAGASRAMIRCEPVPNEPEYMDLSYETPLRVAVEPIGGPSRRWSS